MIFPENDDNARGGNFWKLTFNKGKSQTKKMFLGYSTNCKNSRDAVKVKESVNQTTLPEGMKTKIEVKVFYYKNSFLLINQHR